MGGFFERVVMCIINGRGNTAQDQAKWDAFEQRFINAKAVKPTGGFWDKIWGGKPAAVETGMCKHGCGHPVAPAKGGRKFVTCCRECATSNPKGSKHSKECKNRARKGRGTCRKGCKRPANPKINPKSGKPYSTCCWRCATGKGHTEECDRLNGVEPSFKPET